MYIKLLAVLFILALSAFPSIGETNNSKTATNGTKAKNTNHLVFSGLSDSAFNILCEAIIEEAYARIGYPNDRYDFFGAGMVKSHCNVDEIDYYFTPSRKKSIGKLSIEKYHNESVKLIIEQAPIKLESLLNSPCLTCPVEQKCDFENSYPEPSPLHCQLIEDWVAVDFSKKKK